MSRGELEMEPLEQAVPEEEREDNDGGGAQPPNIYLPPGSRNRMAAWNSRYGPPPEQLRDVIDMLANFTIPGSLPPDAKVKAMELFLTLQQYDVGPLSDVGQSTVARLLQEGSALNTGAAPAQPSGQAYQHQPPATLNPPAGPHHNPTMYNLVSSYLWENGQYLSIPPLITSKTQLRIEGHPNRVTITWEGISQPTRNEKVIVDWRNLKIDRVFRGFLPETYLTLKIRKDNKTWNFIHLQFATPKEMDDAHLELIAV